MSHIKSKILERVKLLRRLTNEKPGESKFTYLEMLSDAPNGFWGEMNLENSVPLIFNEKDVVDPAFFEFLSMVKRKDKDRYHGGCPNRHSRFATEQGLVYYDNSAITILMNCFLDEFERTVAKPTLMERIKRRF